MKRSPLRRRGKRMKSVRKLLWPTFSKLIRARDKTCQFAGYFGKRCGGNLQACHIFPKGTYPLLELHPLNVVAGCYVCHLHGWHKSPLDALKWMNARPTGWMDDLEAARRTSLTRKGWTADQHKAEWTAYGL